MRFSTLLRVARRKLLGLPPLLFGRPVPDLAVDTSPDARVRLIVQVETELGGRSFVVGGLSASAASLIAAALAEKGLDARVAPLGLSATVAGIVKARKKLIKTRRAGLRVVVTKKEKRV